jgi:hypothetical protein
MLSGLYHRTGLMKSQKSASNNSNESDREKSNEPNYNEDIMTKLPIDIVSNLYIEMLKEIILCDYNHVLCYYNTKTDDGDSLSLSATKGRKKVRMLLIKVEEQRRKLSSPDGPSKPITLDY